VAKYRFSIRCSSYGKSKMSSPPDILTCLLGQLPEDTNLGTAPLPLVPADTTRPYVTLTFAQSIDAKIAGAGGKQLIISGEESMKMTHW
jgi:2,5-diamino-6-(ribosylamino)-4(3H)-pyrimidinone 5'-phosphate reductase